MARREELTYDGSVWLRRAPWILLLLSVTALSAHAWGQQNARGAAPADAAVRPVPSVVKAELIGQLLGKRAEADAAAFEVIARRWQQRYWVVLVRGLRAVGLAALGLYGDGEAPVPGRLIASSGTLSLEEREQVIALDLAPFRVTSGKTAIGIRVARTATYAGGGEGRAIILRLYLQREERLESVLSAVTEYECELAGARLGDGTRDHYSVSGVAFLAVSKRKTEGFFDLVKRSGRRAIAVYQWNGNAYASGSSGQYGADVWGGDCEVAHE